MQKTDQKSRKNLFKKSLKIGYELEKCWTLIINVEKRMKIDIEYEKKSY